jgi:electron transport complex protein RnfG
MVHARRKAAFALIIIGLAAAILLAGVDQLTRERIQQARDARAEATLTAMLPDMRFDNDLINDHVDLSIPGLPEPARVYRARFQGQPVAALIDLITPHGYSGDIRMLVAVDSDGTVIATRVLAHRETPGLGDKIEIERNDWIRGFSGRSLDNTPSASWAPDQEGGDFDTLTSATITSAAVIEAVHAVLRGLENAEPGRLWAPVSNS